LLTVFNRREKTLRCLDRLFRQVGLREKFIIEVFLVDDGSTDNTKEEVLDQFPRTHVIQGDGTLFWNRGMHLAWKSAVKKAEYDYFLWLNDDTLIDLSCISTALKTADEYGGSIIVGSTVAGHDSSIYTYGGRAQNGKLIVPGVKPRLAHFFNGNIVLIPKVVYEVVGMNDPYFHHSLGDFDYGLR